MRVQFDNTASLNKIPGVHQLDVIPRVGEAVHWGDEILIVRQLAWFLGGIDDLDIHGEPLSPLVRVVLGPVQDR